MPLTRLSNNDLRSECRLAIDSLELWLRSLIDFELKRSFGSDYINSGKRADSGECVIRKEVQEKIADRCSKSPGRFPRPIDAIDLTDAIGIVCQDRNWSLYFDNALRPAFDANSDMTRRLMNRLVQPRNAISHGNPLSIRDAERIVCYSHDVVDGIKAYLMNTNENEYNVAKIVRMQDSFGNCSNGSTHNTGKSLYPGEKFWVEIEIDSAFEEDSYDVVARCTRTSRSSEQIGSTSHVDIEIGEMDIGVSYTVAFDVIMKRRWHRLGGIDDTATFQYRVLPNPMTG